MFQRGALWVNLTTEGKPLRPTSAGGSVERRVTYVVVTPQHATVKLFPPAPLTRPNAFRVLKKATLIPVTVTHSAEKTAWNQISC
jgi:hypothetical protein